MTNKTTRKVLLLSSLSLLLCFAMLLGTTFAWFTDSVTSSGNKIVAGNLDVQLLMDTGSGYDDISESTDPIFGDANSLSAQNDNADTLWEPGKTQVAYLAIKNGGSLDLKYNVNLVVKNNAKDLYKAMEYAIIPDAQYGDVGSWTSGNPVNVGSQLVSGDVELKNGVTHYFALAIHMQEEAGNEYQGGQVEFDIVVNATQLASESDSFDNTYDENATYELSLNANGVYETNNMAGLSKVAEMASADASITEVSLVDANGRATTIPVARTSNALDSAIAGGNEIVVLTSDTFIIPDSAQRKTLTFVGTGDTVVATQDDGSYEGCDYSLDGATVTFEGIKITTNSATYTGYARLKATYNNCTINGAYTLYDNSTFNNCTFNVSGDAYNIWTWGAPTATFNNCTFNTSGKSILLYGNTNTVLTVNNCTFNDANDYADVNNKAAIETGSDWAADKKTIIANGCTVNGFDVTSKGTNTGSTLWGNKNSLSTDRLSVTIDGTKVY